MWFGGTAGQPGIGGPAHLGDGGVDVVGEQLHQAAYPVGYLTAEVDEPTVVRAHAREPVLVLLGLRRPREQHEAREERRHGVGEDHLGHDALAVLEGEKDCGKVLVTIGDLD